MIYLKRFLYIFTVIILYTLMIPITILYIVFVPFGMIISFVLTEDFVRYFNPLSKLEEYLTFIDDKLERIFLK
jgi:hypothetical protein